MGKHAREDDLIDISSKKVKLDNLFNDLSLNDKPKFTINSKLKGKITKKSYTTSQLDNYINDKIISHLEDVIKSSLKLIKYYNYKWLVYLIYQKWLIKMFNRFVKKYNEYNNTSYKFKTIDEIMRSMNYHEIMKIVFQENELEKKRIEMKLNLKEMNFFKDIKYNYWFKNDDLDLMDIE
ncbi:unnamed protein product [Candida verbasci]|uniref:Uncharacterized protein n=1 Tax=Candida verbasci TaxID=1227364 RepID=A0A9W4TS26_9ASCO|nr:unnamed protein product [Candida verbasci]